MPIARIDNNAVAEERNLDLADVPEHKRHLWRPVVVEGEGPSETVVIDTDCVRRVRSWSPQQRQAAISREAERRQATFAFAGKRFDFDIASRIDIAGAGALAQAAIMAGAQPNDLRWADPGMDFRWVTASNESIAMDAQTCFAFAQTAALWRAEHVYASRALKDSDPIREDFADDKYWPT